MDESTIHRKAVLAALIQDRFDGNQAAFAAKVKRDKSRITQILDPNSAFGQKAAAHMALEIGLPERYFEIGFTGAQAPQVPPRSGVPVVGTAQLGDEGHFLELEYPTGHGDGYVNWSSSDHNAYAVRCRGESMKPRIRHGEFVVVEPGREVRPGDEVLVRAKDGRVMVNMFAFRRDGLIHLDSVNESHPRISVPEDEVQVMHYVSIIAKSSSWRE